MLTTLSVIAMVLLAAYLWRSSEFLHCLSARPHGEEDVTSTGALWLLRAICITVLVLAVMFVVNSGQPTAEVTPESLGGMETLETHSPTAESSLMQE